MAEKHMMPTDAHQLARLISIEGAAMTGRTPALRRAKIQAGERESVFCWVCVSEGSLRPLLWRYSCMSQTLRWYGAGSQHASSNPSLISPPRGGSTPIRNILSKQTTGGPYYAHGSRRLPLPQPPRDDGLCSGGGGGILLLFHRRAPALPERLFSSARRTPTKSTRSRRRAERRATPAQGGPPRHGARRTSKDWRHCTKP